MKTIRLMAAMMLACMSLDIQAQPVAQQAEIHPYMNIASVHPWQGKRVGYIGDSITDPRNGGGKIRKYWQFLQEWLGITPYVYGVSGRQWNDVERQATLLKQEHGDEVDAILVFMGTNDFNHGVPIGEWFAEATEQVYAAQGKPKQLETRRKREPVMDDATFRGRINKGMASLKRLFPDKQIVQRQ